MKTSDGLRDFLIRQGITPTMDRKRDIELARPLLKDGYKNDKKPNRVKK